MPLLNEAAQIEPSRFITDFEKALLQSIAISFPTATVKGCFYHFAQAIWRKIQQLGLQVSYQEEESIRKFFRKVISLVLVLARYLHEAWMGWTKGRCPR